jgi:hypothetical protein
MNDLIALEYGWGYRPADGSGKTDCFQLVCEIRRRMGLTDYADRFAWVYDEYEDATFPRRKVLRWLLQYGTKLETARPGAVALLPGTAGAALGAVTDTGTVFIGPGGRVVQVQLPASLAHYFWMER